DQPYGLAAVKVCGALRGSLISREKWQDNSQQRNEAMIATHQSDISLSEHHAPDSNFRFPIRDLRGFPFHLRQLERTNKRPSFNPSLTGIQGLARERRKCKVGRAASSGSSPRGHFLVQAALEQRQDPTGREDSHDRRRKRRDWKVGVPRGQIPDLPR